MSTRSERAVRPRDAHGEAKLAPRDRQREPRHLNRAALRAEPQELTKLESVETTRWTDASAVLFLVLSFANLVVFYWSLIGF